MNSPSRILRLAIKDRFTASFNTALAAAAEELGIDGFTVNFDRSADAPQNFYEDAVTLDQLMTVREPEFPVCAMWVDEGIDRNLEMPRKFAGAVAMRWRFFLYRDGLRNTGLTELREVVESAMIDCLDPEFSDIAYQSDLKWEPLVETAWIDQDQTLAGWVQEINYSATFEVRI